MKKEIKLLTGIAAGVVLGAGIAQTTNVFADDEVVATPEEVVEQSNENVKEFSEDAVIEEVTEDEAVVTDTEEEIAVEEDATTSTVEHYSR